ncbi:hypothetical protein HanIR_Chr16g0839891 [Helianthus annuus]|nr:hypothetical protein HanIR_Chr16g0839891 [Helianthus annuus]
MLILIYVKHKKKDGFTEEDEDGYDIERWWQRRRTDMLSGRMASAYFQEHSSHGRFVYFIFRNHQNPPKISFHFLLPQHQAKLLMKLSCH